MPPTWLVLVILFSLNKSFDPLLLSLTAAVASTIGRFLLLKMSNFGRRMLSEKRKKTLLSLGHILSRSRLFSISLSFVYALSPLPSNFYFMFFGVIDYSRMDIFIGFFLGRLISYLVAVTVALYSINALTAFMGNSFLPVLIIDGIGLLSFIVSIFINWDRLINRLFYRKIEEHF